MPVVGPTPNLVVDQKYIDDCTKAFDEVVALRAAVLEFRVVGAKTSAERVTSDALIKGLNELLSIKDRTIAAYEMKEKVYDSIIKLQSDMIDRMAKQLSQGKTAWQKFASVLKTVVVLAAGVTFGRGR